jgi:hypothetical protein
MELNDFLRDVAKSKKSANLSQITVDDKWLTDFAAQPKDKDGYVDAATYSLPLPSNDYVEYNDDKSKVRISDKGKARIKDLKINKEGNLTV